MTAVRVSGPRPIRLPRAGDRKSAIDKRPVVGLVVVHRPGLDGNVRSKDPPAPTAPAVPVSACWQSATSAPTTRSPSGPAPRPDGGGALLSAAMRRERARRDGEVAMSIRHWGVPLLVVAAVLGGCGGGEPEESAGDLLSRAKTTLDEADSAHFVLTSDNAPTSGTLLVGGEGDIARPSSFQGTLQVLALGATADLEVVSVDGTVYAQLPFTSGFSVVDPAQFGFGDPGALLDPDTGISQLLAEADNAELGEERRVDGEVVREVTAELPGELVGQILTSADPSTPVDARFSIASESGQLRRAVLTGPFFSAADDATYTLELSDFGADVEITAPPTG